MTDPIELPQTGDPFTDGLCFAAGVTVFAGASLMLGFAAAELFRRVDSRERERTV